MPPVATPPIAPRPPAVVPVVTPPVATTQAAHPPLDLTARSAAHTSVDRAPANGTTTPSAPAAGAGIADPRSSRVAAPPAVVGDTPPWSDAPRPGAPPPAGIPGGLFRATAPALTAAQPAPERSVSGAHALDVHVPSTRALLSAGAAAALVPFANANTATGGLELFPNGGRSAAAAVAAVTTSAAAAAALSIAKRLSLIHRGGRTPMLPPGPPGHVGAGGSAGGPGGVASGVWCALLLGCALYVATELRRHRIPLSLPARNAVVLLLHRPG
jgi:hypothetical protein